VGWARVLIGGMCLVVLCGASGRLAAQTGGQQGIEVAAKEDALALPDAPHPAESALDRGAPFSASSSLQTYSQNQPPSTGPSLSDLGLTPTDTEGNAAAGADGPPNAHAENPSAAGADYGDSGCGCVHQLGWRAAGEGNYSDTTSRDIHIALGATAVAMYAATASYAIRAPRVSHEPRAAASSGTST